MHGDNMAVLTAIWSWHTSELDQTLRALKDLASRLGCAVADSLPGFFERQTTGFSKRVLALVHRALGRDQLAEDPAATPIRAYDAVAELAQEHAAVRKKWSGSASERDEFWKVLRALGLGDAETLADFTARWLGCAHALEVAKKHIATTEREGVRNGEEQLRLHAAVEAAEKLVTKREADIFDLRSEVEALKKAAEVAPIDRDMLSDALDCARREVVWVPESASQAGQADEAGESEQVRNAIEWCTTHAGRGLAAELAQDAARKLQASLATMTGRPTLRWAIAQALHIGAEAAIEWAERYWGGKLEAQQVVGNPVPRPSPAAQIAEQIKADLNKPAAKPGRNVMDEVRGLGEQTERFDRAALDVTRADGQVLPIPTDAVAVHDRVVVRWDGAAWQPVTITSVDGPVPVRPFGWTGITWMSGKGRAKSLTLPGLRLISETANQAKLRADVAGFTDKAKRIFSKVWKRQRLLAFHLPNGVVRHAVFDCYSDSDHGHPQAAAGDIFVWLPKAKTEAPKPARQGIAWRRPGHDVDSFAEVPIRPTFDEGGNQVIEVRGELPDDLQNELKQTSRDWPTITATTVNGAKITGPVGAWQCTRNSDGVVWRLTMPLPNPAPRT